MHETINTFDTEVQVVSSVILDPKLLNKYLPSINLFHSAICKQLIHAIRNLHLNSQPIDPITISDQITDQALFPDHSALQFITEITEKNLTLNNYEEHIKVLKKYKDRRDLYKLLDNCQNSLLLSDSNPMEHISNLQSELLKMQGKTSEHDGETISQAIGRYISRLDERICGIEDVKGIKTGISKIDQRLHELYPGEVTLVGGRPSHGKTILAMQMAYNITKSKHRVLVFSIEMMNIELAERLIAGYANVKLPNLLDANISKENWQNINKLAHETSEYDLVFYEISKLNLNTLLQIIRIENYKKHVELVVIDYVQLMQYNRRNEIEELGNIANENKALSKQLGYHTILVSQLNRQCDSRQDKRPINSDLKASGDLEQVASNIIFCYRDELYNKEDPNNKGLIELITGKARKGIPGIDTMTFEGEYQRIVPLKPRYTFDE